MFLNQISAFEYVSILVSIILGLGITQILSSFSDLLYHYKTIRFYWPHTIWVMFILFLHIQDWFITYQLRNKPVWHLPELLFVLLYPIMLFIAAKMLLPTNDEEERSNMKVFFKSQFPVIFFIIAISILISILFNILLLQKEILQQIPLILFFSAMLYISLKKIDSEKLHALIAIVIAVASVFSVILEKDVWIIK